MSAYLLRRLTALLPVLLGLSLLAFSLASLAPGDPAELLLRRQTGEPPSAADVTRLRSEMGLDRPFLVRYGRWLGQAVQGDLGASYSSGASVSRTLVTNLPATVELAVASLLLGIVIALPLGVLAAASRGGPLDHVSRIVSLVGTSIPGFLLGYMLILFFGVTLKLFPVAGTGGLSHLVLPAMTLALAEAAAMARLTRASMLDVLGEDYVRTARAKGASRRLVYVRHALRNALNPVVTLVGLRVGRLLGGAVIVEVVFARAGIGTVIVDAIHDRDYAMIQGFILFVGIVFVSANLLVDLAYARLDPRVRLGSSEERAAVAR